MMRTWTLVIPAGVIVAGLLCAQPAAAQVTPAQQPPTTAELKKEIEALSERLQSIQKDLQDIKALLRRSQAPAAPQNVVLDLGNHPSVGERTAKLTLVEFSDYQ